MKSISFTFESGTSLEETKEYFETLKEKLKGEFTDEELESLTVTNIKTICDSCDSEISDEEKKKCENNYTFSCKRCGLKYDLCDSCQMDESFIQCPYEFGCNDKVKDKIFIPKKIDKPFEKYEMFGETFIKIDTPSVEMKNTELKNKVDKCKKINLFSAVYFEEKNISYKFIEEMWLIFRCNNTKCLEKYGKPKSFNLKYEFANWEIYQSYEELIIVFLNFISLDEENGKQLFLKIIFPNEDLFIIIKHNKDEIPFVTFFIPVSTLNSDIKNYDVGIFQESLKEKLNLTIEELNEKGQIILVECFKEI
jgi:hypothetical protein